MAILNPMIFLYSAFLDKPLFTRMLSILQSHTHSGSQDYWPILKILKHHINYLGVSEEKGINLKLHFYG